jgi:aspartate aminotransferase
MRELSELAQRIPKSETIAIADKARQMQASGLDVIALAGGEPDFDTPDHIINAGIEAMQAGQTHYAAPSKGVTPLLEAIADKLARDNHVHVNASSDIVVTPGGKMALYLALKAMLNPGDEVLILEPAWVSYPSMVMMVGGTPIHVGLDTANNYAITAEILKSYITPKTKLIMVNSPSKPTGRVLTVAEAQAIAAVALEHDLYVLSDEIYEKIIFDGREHISLASLPDMAERTLIVNGMSKVYAMTGWRLGYLAGPTPVMQVAGKFNSQTVTSAATFTMYASAAALNGPQDIVNIMCESYRERRDFMVKALNEIEGVECASIEGAFYLFPRFPGSKKTSVELADAILEHAQVATVPGSAFGASGEGAVRMSIATATSDLERAVERLARVGSML